MTPPPDADKFAPDPDGTSIGREAEGRTLHEGLSDPCPQHFHIYGPRGSGKTHVTQQVLDDLPADMSTCYISCIRHDTQYKVLRRLCNTFLNGDLRSGYHTSRLQHSLADHLSEQALVLVLDEVDFLLLNDGGDLLYYLTRIASEALRLALISSNYPDLSNEMDDRTFSSLQPQKITFQPYSQEQATRILARRTNRALMDRTLSHGALRRITSTTVNTRLALHWLAEAANATDTAITTKLVEDIRERAVDRYRDTLLAGFTPHHRPLFAAIRDLTGEGSQPVYSGRVYQEYQEQCHASGTGPLTPRRISDYLKHLEHLGLVSSTYHYGGETGKTREIELQQVFE